MLFVFTQFWFGSPLNVLLTYRWLGNSCQCVFDILVFVSLVFNGWTISLACWIFFLAVFGSAFTGILRIWVQCAAFSDPCSRQQYNHNFPPFQGVDLYEFMGDYFQFYSSVLINYVQWENTNIIIIITKVEKAMNNRIIQTSKQCLLLPQQGEILRLSDSLLLGNWLLLFF